LILLSLYLVTHFISSRHTNEEKMLVVLRDGRKLFGVLRSYDQFGEDDFVFGVNNEFVLTFGFGSESRT